MGQFKKVWQFLTLLNIVMKDPAEVLNFGNDSVAFIVD